MVTLSLVPFKGSFLPEQRKLIYLSPSQLKELHLQRGSPVVLTSVNGELLFRCWPGLSKGSEAEIPGFSLFKNYTGLRHSVLSFRGCVYEAESVVFSPQKFRKFMNADDFMLYLKRKLGSVYIKEGMILQLNYLGCSLSLTVQTVFASFIENKECTDKSIFNSSLTSFKDSLTEKCPIRTFGLESSTPVSSPRIQFHTQSNRSQEFYLIGTETRCIIQNPVSERWNSRCQLNDIAGLDEQINTIKSCISTLTDPDCAFGTRGILVVGPRGTGKSFLTDAIQNEYKHLLPLHDIKNGFLSNGIEFLKKLAVKIESKSPCLVLIDDIDKIFLNKDLQSDISSIIYKMLSSSSHLLVIATCQSTDSIPGDLRKNGLIDKEIILTVPSASNRVQIAEKVLQMYENDLTKDHICELSDMAHGFTGFDLKRLCQEAYLKAVEEDSHITLSHLQKSFASIKPSSMANISLKVPDVKWSDIGGMDEVKEAVKEMVDWPLKHPDKLKKFKLIPPRGILMYGPPGCSKTLIAKALASESQLNFLSVKSSEIFNMYVGDSEKSISELFRKARAVAPCILFLDEVDSLIPKRGSTSGSSNVADRVVTQFLVEIDGIDVLEEGVSVIAATNRPERVDPSLLRPGRLDRLIYVHLPDERTRTEIFQGLLQKKPVSADLDLQYMVQKTANYTGAEISAVCLEASKHALKEGKFLNTPPVSMRHFLSALKSVQPRTTKEMLDSFENYHKKFQFKT